MYLLFPSRRKSFNTKKNAWNNPSNETILIPPRKYINGPKLGSGLPLFFDFVVIAIGFFYTILHDEVLLFGKYQCKVDIFSFWTYTFAWSWS